MKLNQIKDNPGARVKKKLLGRGIGSGLGKTSGRGGKGQTARSGVALNGFEGGQNPIYRRLPKRGFVNIHAQSMYELTFKKLNVLIKAKKIDPSKPIDREALISSGAMKKWYEGISLISTGKLEQKVNVEVTRASASAKEAVEKLGGSVKFA
ncbi:MAG: 50S ribosomal protein L15 [Alphaproteobacteria bacterium]|nr:50S ribosomal protein L15 [Alphaproteobacteria bacterium]